MSTLMRLVQYHARTISNMPSSRCSQALDDDNSFGNKVKSYGFESILMLNLGSS